MIARVRQFLEEGVPEDELEFIVAVKARRFAFLALPVMTTSSSHIRHDDMFLQEHSAAQASDLAGAIEKMDAPSVRSLHGWDVMAAEACLPPFRKKRGRMGQPQSGDAYLVPTACRKPRCS
jgi:hypothetical protein